MIYFVQPRGRPFVKIGYARHVGRRVYHLQIANPDELILLGVVAGGLAREAMIHARFAHLRVHGEWFRYTREVRTFLRREAETYQPDVHDPKDAADGEAWEASVAAARPASPGNGRRVHVWVQVRADRRCLTLDWHDLDTGRRKSRSAGTDNRDLAEQRSADLEAALNQTGLRNTTRNNEGVQADGTSGRVAASDSPGQNFD